LYFLNFLQVSLSLFFLIMAATVASRDDCRLHRPGSLYTRNTEGSYSSYAPCCNGCEIGAREDLDLAAAARVRELTILLKRAWESCGGHDELAAQLREAVNMLRERCTDIMTPVWMAEQALNLHETARACMIAYDATRDALSASEGAVTERVNERLGALQLALADRESFMTTYIYPVALELLTSLRPTASSHVPSESADALLSEILDRMSKY
jgi:hypothetical protein